MARKAGAVRNPGAALTAALTGLVMAGLPQLLRAAESGTPSRPDARRTAREVDRLIGKELAAETVAPMPPAGDEDFLRRVSFDLAGTPPAAREVLEFRRDADPGKRAKLIDRLLESEGFALNRARYWRDVIFTRATNARAPLAQQAFEDWLAEQLGEGRGWDEIATAIVTATGDVRENGATALLFAQQGEPEEIAGEVARIFLGIQIQCANCHDHPWDSWKREQFHELAAFFPRVGVRPKREGERIISYEIVSVDGNGGRRPGRGFLAENPERAFRDLDRNRDGRITKSEAANTPAARFLEQLIERGDANQDGGLSLAEVKELRPPDNVPGRGSSEHTMPDLNDSTATGKRIDPLFFVTEGDVPPGLSDLERREALARELTSPDNPWFARAVVTRVWAELLGQGFYTPVDDIGPERTAALPEVLDVLARGFVASGHDLKWLFRTIANTEAYQRQARADAPTASPETALASARPTRIRADQLFSALIEIAGIPESSLDRFRGRPGGQGPGGGYGRMRSPRAVFNALFGYDPSTPQDELTGTVPQALFLMNSQQIDRLARAAGRTRLAGILRHAANDHEAVREVYLLALSREPTTQEQSICVDYTQDVGNREEAFEDLLWCLLNSSEFVTKR